MQLPELTLYRMLGSMTWIERIVNLWRLRSKLRRMPMHLTPALQSVLPYGLAAVRLIPVLILRMLAMAWVFARNYLR